jgi:hypothetical protein
VQQQLARTTEQLDFSHQQGFAESLAHGEAAEELVMQKYRQLGFTVPEVDRSASSLAEKRAWDFAVTYPFPFTVEVKRDMLARDTGNVCIEHRAVAHSRATYFVYAIDGCPQVFQLDHMRAGSVEDSTLTRLIRKYSHTWAQRGYGSAYWSTLVPVQDFIRYATPL